MVWIWRIVSIRLWASISVLWHITTYFFSFTVIRYIVPKSMRLTHKWQLIFIVPAGSVKAQVTLCRSFFADVPDHSRLPRPVMIVTKPSDRGLNSRSLSVQDCQYDLSTTAVRHWYDGSVWSALSTFATTITTTTETIETTALTMLPTTPTLLPICYHD